MAMSDDRGPGRRRTPAQRSERQILRRLGTEPESPATPDGHFRRVDGRLRPKRVRFWVGVRKREEELVGAGATQKHDYCMREVRTARARGNKG